MDDGVGRDKWSYKTRISPNRHHQQTNTNTNTFFYRPDVLSVAQPYNLANRNENEKVLRGDANIACWPSQSGAKNFRPAADPFPGAW